MFRRDKYGPTVEIGGRMNKMSWVNKLGQSNLTKHFTGGLMAFFSAVPNV